jgi:phosphinothricin acetyltransferase
MQDTAKIRDALASDAACIAAIYNQGIVDRIATLEVEERTPEERSYWLTTRETRHPVLVAEVHQEVVGWGSLNPFNSRKAYDFVADSSIYVERSWRGKGVGSALLLALIERARQLGYHKMVLAAFPWNTAGLALYQRFDFRTVGIYQEQGLLDGKWVDTLVMEKIL